MQEIDKLIVNTVKSYELKEYDLVMDDGVYISKTNNQKGIFK